MSSYSLVLNQGWESRTGVLDSILSRERTCIDLGSVFDTSRMVAGKLDILAPVLDTSVIERVILYH